MTPTAHNHPEPEERAHNQVSTLSSYPPDIAEMVRRAAEVQSLLQERGGGWGDTLFAKGSGVSATVWYRLRLGQYTSRNLGKLARAIAAHAEALERRTRGERGISKAEPVRGFVPTTAYRALAKALDMCRALAAEGDEDRLVVIVGKQGMGKTTTARQTLADLLESRRPAWLLHAMPSWGQSYHAFLSKIAADMGLDGAGSSARLEELLLRDLAGRKEPVLMVEEVEELGGRALSFVKAILNETRTTVVLFMTPEFEQGLARSRKPQACQLLRRKAAHVPLGGVEDSVIRALAEDLWRGAPDDVLRLVAAEAQSHGGYNFVKRVHRKARNAVARASQRPCDALAGAVQAARRQLAA